jgi:sarcosine oxidase/L-pipecolate oxidase
MDCAGSEDGIKGLAEQYRSLMDSDAGLKETTEWLDNEDEILAKMPLLKRENIKVSLP